MVYKGVYNKNGVEIDVAIKTIKGLVYQLNNEITILALSLQILQR